jgi:transposase-like protein
VAWDVTVGDEAVWQWGLKFGRDFAISLRRRGPRRGDKWHFDEGVLAIGGKRIISGGLWTRMASSLTRWSRAGEMRSRLSGCSKSC